MGIHTKAKIRHDLKEVEIKLSRELGLFQTTLIGVGIILGAGIYALIGKAAGMAGNAVWISFLFAAAVAALTGLSYAELSSMFPSASGEYIYSRRSFGPRVAFLVGWLIIVGGMISSSTVALGFGGYFSALFGGNAVMVAVVLIAVLSLVIFWGIRQSAWLGIIFTIIEAAGLIIIILIAAPRLGAVDYLEMASGLRGILGAAALIFFAFIGFEGMVRLSEETKDSRRVIPKALVLSIAITTILYIMVAISAVSVVDWGALGRSASPLADVASTVFGNSAFILLSFIALFSTLNTVLLMMLSNSRIIYGMSRMGSLPRVLGRVHRGRRTPWVSVLLVGLLSMAFALAGDIYLAANLTNFTIFIIFMVVNLSVIKLRYRKRWGRRFRVPVNIGRFPVLPLLGAVFSALMLLSIEPQIILYGVLLTAAGLVFYKVMSR